MKKGKEKKTRYILSIDGGGMRGIIPAYILNRLDTLLEKEGDLRPLYSHFDLIAGTSTGALLALALSCPAEGGKLKADSKGGYPVYQEERSFFFRKKEIYKGRIRSSFDPKIMEDIYLKNGERIFPHQKSFLGPIFQDKYDVRPFEAFLKENLLDYKMNDLLAPTVIVSYDTLSGNPFLFTSYSSCYSLFDASRASTAAPLYFPPHMIEDGKGIKRCLVDGGLCANNPALVAYIEAKKLYPDTDEFVILSLSTCKKPFSFDASKTGGGITGWAYPILKSYMSAQESMMNLSLENLPDARYIRIYSDILEKKISLDDVSRESLDELKRIAELLYKDHECKIKEIAHEISMCRTRENVKLEYNQS
ncbi:MAG TPA: patatin-like phospholipase family protein [Candidatus Ornithospirochaeta avicola]|uniref:Patatin-like phospholipase family protein n=1 Tax=Candidatus Ornithospirochaeta avicola TaxID=2840896 RepID=A0A9D1TP08_9SPIO|nr:patatin-like phospholipase family protein [Candidatus Ornithospirochaeta avicola]